MFDMNQNLKERIQDAINSDDADSNNESISILDNYSESTIDQQKAIDRCFICLCGWSLKTLIQGKEAENYNPFK